MVHVHVNVMMMKKITKITHKKNKTVCTKSLFFFTPLFHKSRDTLLDYWDGIDLHLKIVKDSHVHVKERNFKYRNEKKTLLYSLQFEVPVTPDSVLILFFLYLYFSNLLPISFQLASNFH